MRYQVIVSNVGKVLDTDDRGSADHVFREYMDISLSNFGRAGGEDVTLFDGREIINEFRGIYQEDT